MSLECYSRTMVRWVMETVLGYAQDLLVLTVGEMGLAGLGEFLAIV